MEEESTDFFVDGEGAGEQLDETLLLEQTIANMEESQLCFHPIHHHSFAPVNFLISGSMRKCVGCEQRLKAVLGMSSDVVRCVSCGAYAHRSCAMDTPSRPQDFALMWNTKCPVNTALIEGGTLQGSPTVGLEDDGEDEVLISVEGDEGEKTSSTDDNPDILLPQLEGKTIEAAQNDGSDQQASSPRSMFQFLSPSNLLFTGSQPETTEDTPKELSVSSDEEEDEGIMLWTLDGPPRHWANEQALSGIHRSSTAEAENDNANEEEDVTAPLHVANNTFATVSRALQENIVAHFIRRPFIERVISVDSAADSVSQTAKHGVLPQTPASPRPPERIIERAHTADSPVSRVDMEALLTEVEPSSPKRGSIRKMASGTLEAAKTSAALRKKMGIVTVAGGIAGGVAGLCVAGPAGAVIGAKCGQTAGLLGVILEGSMTVGVFVAGVAAGSFTAQHIQQQQEKRVLTIGEDGVKQKLLLVRPNVDIDPVWEEICAKARSSHSSSSLVFGLLPSSQSKMTKKERYKRDHDIVETDESEIPTADKVLLLVSRSLNDKESLPGHIYKCLIQEYRERCKAREMATKPQDLGTSVSEEEMEPPIQEESELNQTDSARTEEIGETQPSMDEVGADERGACKEEEDIAESAKLKRARRQDAHAVIKHVTATLLEVRPGFAASPAVTEMSAVAVESLVFGELYDSVFEEVAAETCDSDGALLDKISVFDAKHGDDSCLDGLISQPAIEALLMLTEAHSAADKLRYCVEFLEQISVHFEELSKTRSKGKPSSLTADSLLKMCCQHLIAAKVPCINAEILFLEEFARDEQLLRGKEGYALVTLQASLHFLNLSTNFDEDIFDQDEAEI